jgi:hypothetical protein
MFESAKGSYARHLQFFVVHFWRRFHGVGVVASI